jgi:hypothetical protein
MTVHVAAQVRLNPPGWQALRLELSGEGGPVYTIESTINLRNWQPLKTVTNETLALDFSDASADGLFARFYRARSEATGKVVSTSAVGFVELDIPYGFSMRANPLITDQNTVGSLLKGVPAGIMVYKYISGVNFSVNGFEDGAWDRPEESFGPGEGLFVRNGTIDTYWLSIVGKVPEGTLSVSIPVGWSILSSPLPKAGRADTILGCPFERGDNVHRYITELYQYEGHAYAGNGVWQIGGPPEIEFGEAFWVWTKRAATWTVTFSSKE